MKGFYRFTRTAGLPFSLIALLWLLFAVPAFAGEPDEKPGAISGTVSIADGSAAAEVAVVLTETGQTSISDAEGSFRFQGLRPGDYHLVVNMAGYAPMEQRVTVGSGKTTETSLVLHLTRKELQEVVITGRNNRMITTSSDYVSKMPLKALENPQVYSTLTKELLQEQLVFSVDDALKNVPGLTKMWDATGRGGDGGSFYNMRGFIVQSQLRNGVAGNVTSQIDAANLERIEVIKGPSATLFGSALTSYGGLINRVTKKPYEHFGGEVTYAGGSYQYNRISADVNTPLDKQRKALLRINTAYTYEGSFRDHGFSKNFAVAPSFLYKANKRLTLQLDAEFYTGQNTGLNVFFFPYKQTIEALGASRADELNIDYKKSYASNDLYQTSRNINLFGQANYKLSGQWQMQTVVTSTSSYSDGPSPYFYLLPGNQTISRNDQFTRDSKDRVLEIQQNFNGDFHLGSLRNRFAGGVDFMYRNSNQFFAGGAFDTIPTQGNIPGYDRFNRKNLDALYAEKGIGYPYPIIYKANTYSAYVSDVLNITDNLMVLAALRIDHYDHRGSYDEKGEQTAKPYNQTSLSPKFGIVYEPVKDKVSLFANYQNGFTNKTGLDYNKQPFKPEQANQLEGGVKLLLLEGKLSATVSYYNIKVKDMVRPYNGPTPNLSIQDGTQVSRGVETEIVASPIRGMNIIAGFAYNDSKMVAADKDIEGRRPGTAASPYTANLWVSYRIPQGRLKGLGAGFGGNYASDNSIIDDAALGVFILPAYTVLNSTIFYDHRRFRVAVKMDNLTNQRYFIGYTTVNPQKLRSVTGSVSFRF